MSDGPGLELRPPVKMKASERLRGLGLCILLLEMKQLKQIIQTEHNMVKNSHWL